MESQESFQSNLQKVGKMEDELDKLPEWVRILRQAVLESEEVSKNRTGENRLDKVQ